MFGLEAVITAAADAVVFARHVHHATHPLITDVAAEGVVLAVVELISLQHTYMRTANPIDEGFIGLLQVS